ncbi:MAG TPA: sigma-70 family RNA polymerase sigma factor [Myxococcota bacterium]|nr:sigma-70 family RNA polymerase sigma factor [Myxococcota bacterium]
MATRERSTRTSFGGGRDRSLDGDLVRRLLDSDLEAFERVYERHSPRVYALCLRMLKSPDLAEEALQDTFWQLWSRPDRFDPERGALITFLFQVARSRCLDRLRFERRRGGDGPAPATSVEIPDLVSPGPTPFQSASFAEDRSRVRGALDAIAPECRDVVVLAYFENLSQSEIASTTATPLGTVKARMRRGLLQLRGLLGGGGES